MLIEHALQLEMKHVLDVGGSLDVRTVEGIEKRRVKYDAYRLVEYYREYQTIGLRDSDESWM